MQELLRYLYQPSTFTSLMLNVSACATLFLVLIGFVAASKKSSKLFFFSWLVLLLLCGGVLAYSANEMIEESNLDSLRKEALISRQGNSLVITSESSIVKNVTIAIEDESDKNIYVKIKDRYVQIAKSDL